MSTVDLEAIRALAVAARKYGIARDEHVRDSRTGKWTELADAIDTLLAEVERLRAENAGLRDALKSRDGIASIVSIGEPLPKWDPEIERRPHRDGCDLDSTGRTTRAGDNLTLCGDCIARLATSGRSGK